MVFTVESEHFVEDLKLNLLQISLQIVKQDVDGGLEKILGWIHPRSYNKITAKFGRQFLKRHSC